MSKPKSQKTLTVLLFDKFELLDVCGPLEMFGNVSDSIRIHTVSEHGGNVGSTQGVMIHADHDFAHAPLTDWLLIPGGIGTRSLVDDARTLDWIAKRAHAAELVMSVCTGAGLLARAGVLDGRRATSNKRAFAWVKQQGAAVEWVAKARWVVDDKFVTSAGVSAGIDMALAVIETEFSRESATALAQAAEYEWHDDARWDPFAALNKLV